MKRSVFTKILLITLIVLQFATLVACDKGANDGTAKETTGTTADTSSPVETFLVESGITLTDENGKAKYAVIRSENAGKALVTAAADLRNDLNAKSGASFTIASDWVKKGDPVDNESYEILVGATNRDASVEAVTGLGIEDYKITLSGNKIVICGGSDEATIAALEYFRANCLDGVKVTLNAPYSYIKDYKGKDARIGSSPVSAFTIIYPTSGESEEGKTVAVHLQNAIATVCGCSLPIKTDTASADANACEIVIGKSKRDGRDALYADKMDAFYYKMKLDGNRLYLAGGGCFALDYCVNFIRDTFSEGKSIEEGFKTQGSMYGKQIYDLEKGASFRIMSNNVWQCDNNNSTWAALGEDCSAAVRSRGLAAVYMAYYPDVICFQEMSVTMINLIRKELKNNGFSYALISAGTDYTCLLFRNDRLRIDDSGYHKYEYGNNGGTKSYSWGYFHTIDGNKTFAVISTHLWWKSESVEPGSNASREKQAAELVKFTDRLISKYNCPVFVMGDFNTKCSTNAYKVFTDGGMKDAYDVATVLADNRGGHHTCGPDGFARDRTDATYKNDAIDHIMLKNLVNGEVLTFNHAEPYFYAKLSDHYPLYIDINIK